ncbi:MAG TPA: cyclic nucleotide-binding domain-containing protein [Thermoanaerobaculia bacterium]|nr:cyclic nucleotide-binding domain-containing protein [Thermoanaerobaculia bacterium]
MAELARIETVVLLQSVDFFSACTAEEVLRIASIAHERRVAAGEELFRERDTADTLYCVVRGEIEVRSRDGRTEVVGPLQTAGLFDLLSGRLHGGRAVARTEALLLAIAADDFFDLLSNNIELVKSLFRHLIHRIDQDGKWNG